MGLVVFILVGAFIGWIAAAIEEVDEGVLLRIGLGVTGAILGAVVHAILRRNSSISRFSWLGMLFAVIGAIALLGQMHRPSKTEAPDVPHDSIA